MRNLTAGLFILSMVGLTCELLLAVPARAQNRGVYPLGMSATNSGFKHFQEFSNRSTFQGHSIQISGAIKF